MKSLKLIGLSLLAVFALGAFAASAFAAEAGFLPTPTTAKLSGAKSTLESASKAKIECTKSDEVELKFSNDKTATAKLHFLGCKSGGFAVNSISDKTEEILVTTKFLVCLDPKTAAGTLLAEFGIAGEVEGTLELEQPATGVKISVKGTALSAVLTTGEATSFTVDFLSTGKEGKQTVTECLQGETKIKHNLESSFNKGAFEPSSEAVESGVVVFPAKVKLMDS
jgi:hypothetical protein